LEQATANQNKKFWFILKTQEELKLSTLLHQTRPQSYQNHIL